MELLIKLSEGATMPKYAKAGDAGLDITATGYTIDEYENVVYNTGVSVKIPDGYVGLLFPRSSNSKKDIILINGVGVIDSGYTGELIFKYRPIKRPVLYNRKDSIYSVGDRIGQLVIVPVAVAKLKQVATLPTTERGEGGYGSTGK
jgi:dUTP pyrophosphatase